MILLCCRKAIHVMLISHPPPISAYCLDYKLFCSYGTILLQSMSNPAPRLCVDSVNHIYMLSYYARFLGVLSCSDLAPGFNNNLWRPLRLALLCTDSVSSLYVNLWQCQLCCLTLCRSKCLAAMFPTWWTASILHVKAYFVLTHESIMRSHVHPCPYDNLMSWQYVCLSIVLISTRSCLSRLEYSTKDHGFSIATSLFNCGWSNRVLLWIIASLRLFLHNRDFSLD